jgi:O-acetyl-ADP-ribose deacetylase (regulator of RNase III)
MTNIELVKGDITTQKVDAIVNCTTTKMVIGGGALDTAIHKAAGPDLMKECKQIMSEKLLCVLGECIVSGSYKLPCKKIIHTTGPVYMGGSWNEAERLADCYRNCVRAADAAGLESIAFPNICTGAHTYPKEDAARIAIATVREALAEAASVKKAVFVCFEDENYDIYRALLEQTP